MLFAVEFIQESNTARMMKRCCLISVILSWRKEDAQMDVHTVTVIEGAIEYIETHLDQRIDLESVASSLHYSRYHLHRMFTDTVGMTIHDYAVRRRLTEAAKLLVFSERSILEIALVCGYESQQSFTDAFKAMYKFPPAEYRRNSEFYPLQLKFHLSRQAAADAVDEPDRKNVRLAEQKDIPGWMELVRLAIDGYPYLDEADYVEKLQKFIRQKRALVMEKEGLLIGVIAFSYASGSIEFLGVHPQYRKQGVRKILLDVLMEKYLPGREISITTYRERDRADTGYRKELKRLGFAERELLMEFGYPTQRFVRPPEKQEDREDG